MDGASIGSNLHLDNLARLHAGHRAKRHTAARAHGLGNILRLDALRQLRRKSSAMPAPTALLTARAPTQGLTRRNNNTRIDASRLLSVGAKHTLAKIAYLGLQHLDLAAQGRNLGLARRLTRPGLGQLMLVSPFNPLGALRSAFMHAAPILGLVAQLNVLSVRHPDCWRLARYARRRRCTGNSR